MFLKMRGACVCGGGVASPLCLPLIIQGTCAHFLMENCPWKENNDGDDSRL